MFVRGMKGYGGKEERGVIAVGGGTLTSGPAWAAGFTVWLREAVCLSEYSRFVRLSGARRALHSSLHPPLRLFFSQSQRSPSLPLPLRLLLFLPLAALSVANQPTSTHAHTHVCASSPKGHTHALLHPITCLCISLAPRQFSPELELKRRAGAPGVARVTERRFLTLFSHVASVFS